MALGFAVEDCLRVWWVPEGSWEVGMGVGVRSARAVCLEGRGEKLGSAVGAAGVSAAVGWRERAASMVL